MFALFGVLIAIYGDLLGGLVVVLFFGPGVLVSLMPALGRTRGPDRQVSVVAHRGLRTEALVFPLSVAKARVAGLAAAGWAAAGVILSSAPSSTTLVRLLGVVCALLFGGVAIVVGLQQLRGSAFVALLPEGVLARSAVGDSFVPWDVIEAVGVVAMSDTPLVVIRAADPTAVETPRWARLFARANRAMIDADVTYASLVAPEEDVVKTIGHYVEHPEERSRIGQ